MSDSESKEVKVGSLNRVPRRPLPSTTPTTPTTPTTASNHSAESVTEVSSVALSAKLDQINNHLQAIDWKLWVYLKANSYID